MALKLVPEGFSVKKKNQPDSNNQAKKRKYQEEGGRMFYLAERAAGMSTGVSMVSVSPLAGM